MNAPELTVPYASSAREAGVVARIAHWYPADCAHRPPTEARVAYDDEAIHLHYRVDDRHIVCRSTAFQQPVYKDSCVEFFVHPAGAPGYFNFEFNALGAMLASYVEDPTRTADGFVKYARLSANAGNRVRIAPTWSGEPGIVDPGPTVWELDASIPWTVFAAYCDAAAPPAPGSVWRGNFYKCGDDTPVPHWGAWSDVGERLDFHQPERFGRLNFGPQP